MPCAQLPANTGIRRFVNMLGGDSVVKGIYDIYTSNSITSASNVVSSWADARGSSSFGPSLTAPSGKRPTLDLTTTFSIKNSSGQYLETTTTSAFDASKATALIYVGTQDTTANASYAAIADSSAGNCYLQFYTTGGPLIAAQGLFSDTAIASSVAAGSTVRALMVTVNGSTGITLDASSGSRVSGTGTAQSTANCALQVFSFWEATEQAAIVQVRMIAVLNSVPSATTFQNAIRQYCASRYGAT